MSNHANVGTHREDHVPVDLNQPLVLEVHNPNGDVTVRASERSDVLVSHVTHGLPGDADDEGVLTIDAHANRIEVRAHPHNVMGWGGFTGDVDLEAVVGQITKAFRWGGSWSPGKVRFGSGSQVWCDIAIEVPRTMSGRVEAQTASGDVRLEEVRSEIALTTASGDVRVLGGGGELRLRTASGDVVTEGVSGHLSAQSASGDLHIGAAQLNGFEIQTASGDLILDALLSGDAPCRAQTASGDVRLTLRRPAAAGEEPAATLAFHTISGDARVTPPFRKTERRRWQAGAGNGGPHIEIKTVSGDLSAGLAAVEGAFVPPVSPPAPAAYAPPPPPAPPAPAGPPSPLAPAPPVSWPGGERESVAINGEPEAAEPAPRDDAARHAILEAVERGEIDVEEALRRLEAADSVTSP